MLLITGGELILKQEVVEIILVKLKMLVSMKRYPYLKMS